MGGGKRDGTTAWPPSCLRPRSARAPFSVTHASPSPPPRPGPLHCPTAQQRGGGCFLCWTREQRPVSVWELGRGGWRGRRRRRPAVGAALPASGGDLTFPPRPPLHFGRACRRHVVPSPGPPLSPRLRSRGPCAWARGLSPIGGRRLRGGSLVIGRRRGGRGPGTLLVTPAPAWGWW